MANKKRARGNIRWTDEKKHELIAQVDQKKSEGKTVTQAFEELTSVFPLSANTIGAQYYTFLKEIEKPEINEPIQTQEQVQSKKRGRPPKNNVVTSNIENELNYILLNNINSKEDLSKAIVMLINHYIEEKDTKLDKYEKAFSQLQNLT